jgi:hypothetical protein
MSHVAPRSVAGASSSRVSRYPHTARFHHRAHYFTFACLHAYDSVTQWKRAFIRLKVSRYALYLLQTRETQVEDLLAHLIEQYLGGL